MAYKKLKIICDADDVLISCNAYALQLLSQTKGQYFDISGITAWGSLRISRSLSLLVLLPDCA